MKYLPDMKFYDAQGIPVSTTGESTSVIYPCAAWDVLPPREFDPYEAWGKGVKITKEQFEGLVKRIHQPKGV